MKFEDSFEAFFKKSGSAATLKLIEFLVNEENFEQLFDYWNSLNQYQLQKERSDSIYKQIVTTRTKYEKPELRLNKGSSVYFDCDPLEIGGYLN